MATAINQGQALRCAGLISGRQLQPRWQMRDAGAAAGTDGQYAHDGGAIVSVALIIGIFWLLRGSLKPPCCSSRCCFRSQARSGVHEVHGLFAPPFGVGYYAACAIHRGDLPVDFHRVRASFSDGT
jgi:hypothetical protein